MVIKLKLRRFLISDINTEMFIQETTRKDILGYIDEHIENIAYGCDMSDHAIHILYKDGSVDVVAGNDYDGHKIKRINIISAVVDDACISSTYGNYEINQYGVVTPAEEMKIDENIREIK